MAGTFSLSVPTIDPQRHVMRWEHHACVWLCVIMCAVGRKCFFSRTHFFRSPPPPKEGKKKESKGRSPLPSKKKQRKKEQVPSASKGKGKAKGKGKGKKEKVPYAFHKVPSA